MSRDAVIRDALRLARSTGGRLYREDGGPTDDETVNPLMIGAQGSTTSGPIQGLPETNVGEPGDVNGLVRHITTGGIMGGSIAPTKPSEPAPAPRALNDHGIYSKLGEALQTLPAKLTGRDATGMLSKIIKPDEMKWSGMGDYLSQLGNGPTTRDALIQQHASSNPLTTKMDMLTNEYSPANSKVWTPENINDHPSSKDAATDMFLDEIRLNPAYQPFGVTKHPEYNVAGSPNQNKWAVSGVGPRGEIPLIGSSYLEAGQRAKYLNDLHQGSLKPDFMNAITPDRLHQYMKFNGYLGSKSDYEQPEFADRYQTPGGSNYRELLIKPEGGPQDAPHQNDQFTDSNHYPQHSNVIGTARVQDHQTPDGQKVTLADELQSFWAQKGRDSGFKQHNSVVDDLFQKTLAAKRAVDASQAGLDNYLDSQPDSNNFMAMHRRLKEEGDPEYSRMMDAHNKLVSDQNQLSDKYESANKGIVGGPFVDNTSKWTDLTLKHAIHQAAQDGSDYFAWPTGEQVADRYSMRHQLNNLSYRGDSEGDISLHGQSKDGQTFSHYVKDNKLNDMVGKDMADKMRSGDIGSPIDGGWKSIEGNDFDIGGMGHRKSYNEIIPQRVKDVMKKAGYGNTDVIENGVPIVTGEPGGRMVHGIQLTPQLRQRILQQGFPQYVRGGFVNSSMPKAMSLSNDEDAINDALRMARNAGGRLGYGDGGDISGLIHTIDPMGIIGGGGRTPRAVTEPIAKGVEDGRGTQEIGSLQARSRGQTGAETGGLPVGGGLRGSPGMGEASPEGGSSSDPLTGLPTTVKIPLSGKTLSVGPNPLIRKAAENYMESSGLDYNPPKKYAKVDPERSKRIADAYEAMPHAPNDPLVKASYDQLAKETIAQYEAAKAAGAKFEFWDPNTQDDPYKDSPRLAVEDLKSNHHMFVYPTLAGFGSDEATKSELSNNPLLAMTKETWNGQPVTVNDMFRAIHDYYGHAKEGFGFRADGEENAWRSHAAMFSPLARLAMTSETRGQNSWLNYGPHGEENRNARTEDTHFADQKTGVLPPWVQHEGAEDFVSPEDVAKMKDAYSKYSYMGTNSFPGIIGRADPAKKVLEEKAAQMEFDKNKRTQPTGENVFNTSPEAYARTTSIVPQVDFSGKYPQPIPGKPLPLNNRMAPIINNADAIAAQYASKMEPFKDKNVQNFYHTGPIYEGIAPSLGGMDAARKSMETFGSTYAGTSPRTATDQNLSNASLMAYKHANGIPLDKTVLDTGTANDKGYPMMDMHKDLVGGMLRGEDLFNSNPKPSSFRENIMGNHEGVTVDTHNIRGILKSFDELRPGKLPREWFNSDESYSDYKKNGLTPKILSGGIEDRMKDQAVGGKKRQSEYGPMADITERAAKIIGVPRAPAQSLGWFGSGAETNLRSAPSTLVDLLNQRINVTAQHLGIKPEVVRDLWAKHAIPLMNRGGEVGKNGKGKNDEAYGQGGTSQVPDGSDRAGDAGALQAEQKATLTHWSHELRQIIDPEFSGTNLTIRGAETRRRGYKNFHKRTYWGMDGGYTPEPGIGKFRHTAELNKSDLYDYKADPLGLQSKIKQGANSHPLNEYENLIKTSGFKGYHVQHPELGHVAAVFDPVVPKTVTNDDQFARGGFAAKAMSLSRDPDDVSTALRQARG